jgi:hypothetical protein
MPLHHVLAFYIGLPLNTSSTSQSSPLRLSRHMISLPRRAVAIRIPHLVFVWRSEHDSPSWTFSILFDDKFEFLSCLLRLRADRIIWGVFVKRVAMGCVRIEVVISLLIPPELFHVMRSKLRCEASPFVLDAQKVQYTMITLHMVNLPVFILLSTRYRIAPRPPCAALSLGYSSALSSWSRPSSKLKP